MEFVTAKNDHKWHFWQLKKLSKITCVTNCFWQISNSCWYWSLKNHQKNLNIYWRLKTATNYIFNTFQLSIIDSFLVKAFLTILEMINVKLKVRVQENKKILWNAECKKTLPTTSNSKTNTTREIWNQ